VDGLVFRLCSKTVLLVYLYSVLICTLVYLEALVLADTRFWGCIIHVELSLILILFLHSLLSHSSPLLIIPGYEIGLPIGG